MRDFRPQIKIKSRHEEILEILKLLKAGCLGKALRRAKRIEYIIPQERIDQSARKLFRSRQFGTLLSLIDRIQVNLPYDTDLLLIRTFNQRDYHSFLKQVHRLGRVSRHAPRVHQAIAAIYKSQPSEASDWFRKVRPEL